MKLEKWYDAIDNNKMKTIKTMIKNGFDVTTDNDYAFRRAAYNGNLELIELLLKNGANINVNKSYALRTCIFGGYNFRHVECIKYLIKCGVIMPSDCLKIVAISSYSSHNAKIEVFKILIDGGAELDTGNNELIYDSCGYDHDDYEYVKYILDRGIVVYPEKIKSGKLYLGIIIYKKRYDIIESLIKNGFDATTLLPEVFRHNDKNATKLLFEYIEDVNQVDFDVFMDSYNNCYYDPNFSRKWLIKLLIRKGLSKKFLEGMLQISCKYHDHKIITYLEENMDHLE